MNLPDKEFYYLREAADILGCKVSDLIHYGATSKLAISINVDIPQNKRIKAVFSNTWGYGYSGRFQVSKEDLSVLDEDSNAEEFLLSSFYVLLDELNDNYMELFKPDDWNGLFGFEDGVPIKVKRNRLIISHADLICFQNKYSSAHEGEILRSYRNASNKTQGGGRTKEPLTEAIEYTYFKFLQAGETEILKRGNTKEFVKRLKELSNEGNRNADAYIVERIEEVKIPRQGHCTIKTQEKQLPTAHIKKAYPAKTYQLKDISKRLSELRKRHPLPA